MSDDSPAPRPRTLAWNPPRPELLRTTRGGNNHFDPPGIDKSLAERLPPLSLFLPHDHHVLRRPILTCAESGREGNELIARKHTAKRVKFACSLRISSCTVAAPVVLLAAPVRIASDDENCIDVDAARFKRVKAPVLLADCPLVSPSHPATITLTEFVAVVVVDRKPHYSKSRRGNAL
ncbi:hypothetical protein C8R46DRAFT_1226033 [Mycena filopes]|nr:hypothetical protein C8R46DRAFT_1226033 [Mycena filopes]